MSAPEPEPVPASDPEPELWSDDVGESTWETLSTVLPRVVVTPFTAPVSVDTVPETVSDKDDVRDDTEPVTVLPTVPRRLPSRPSESEPVEAALFIRIGVVSETAVLVIVLPSALEPADGSSSADATPEFRKAANNHASPAMPAPVRRRTAQRRNRRSPATTPVPATSTTPL